MKTCKFWRLTNPRDITTPAKLQPNPDQYGGLGGHMLAAIRGGVVTMDIDDGDGMHCAVQTADPAAVTRVLADGGVDIESTGYWSAITGRNVSVLFKGTAEPVPLWRGGMFA